MNITSVATTALFIVMCGLLSGCVSTVGDPANRTAVVGNANTDPQALAVAKRTALEQRQAAVRQPVSIARERHVGIELTDDRTDVRKDYNPRSNSQFVLDHQAPGTAIDLQAAPVETPVVPRKFAYLPTEGLPALSGIRFLGVAAGNDGTRRYMFKQKDHVAGIVAEGEMLQVGVETYMVRGLGVASVVVEDVTGKRFSVPK